MDSGAPISLDGQVAIVTGAGRGLGRAYASALATRGAAVLVNDIVAQNADRVVDEIIATGGRAAACSASVATLDGGVEIFEAAIVNFGTVDVLINNAGTVRPGYFYELSWDDIREQLEVHLVGSMTVTKPVWRHMIDTRNGGRIIMTTSLSGMFSHGGLAGYASAKGGIFSLMKALASEGLDHGIAVNAVLPIAATEINDANRSTSGTVSHVQRYFGDLGETLLHRRDPALVAHLVTYLASRNCAVTGEAFSAVGGRYARVFVGVADGWLEPDLGALSPEAIRDHFAQIRDLSSHTVPNWGQDEIADVGARLRRLGAPAGRAPE